jgi:ATP-dependent DNA ligase
MERYLPMLAVPAEPFDSAEYLFEVKWNGVRALATCADGQWLLWGRDRAEYQERYPELAGLNRLPSGTVVDGEVVLLSQGLPDLDALLSRHQLCCPGKIRRHSQEQPVSYVVFDALYADGHSLLGQPLPARREIAQNLVRQLNDPRVAFSEGLVGPGRVFFDAAVRQGQEGIMAKHLRSRYLPGRRSAAWKKIKPVRELACAVIGFLPGRGGVRGLLVAALRDGRLRYVGRLRSGFTMAARVQLQTQLAARVRPTPVVPCSVPGVWVEPTLFCMVRFLEWTRQGYLRGARYRGLLDEAAV